MKLSMGLGYTGDPKAAARRAREFESAGIDMVWVAELYSFDAVSILGYLAGQTERMELASGILPLYSRTPTLTAMTAAGLDAVSEGRFVLGLGASGPQVIEGWHGVPYTKPLTATKEIIDICRKVWKRERVEYDGELYKLPLPADQGTGLGKPLKIINHPVRENIPIYIASLGPKNVQMTAELADGWLPAFFHPDKAREVFGPDLDAGAARRDPSLAPLYVGGMGAKGKNFYNNVFRRYGYEAEAEKIQDLYLSGQKAEAEALVPDDYLEATALVGDEGRVRERIEAYKAAGVTRLSITPVGDDPLALIEKVKAWAD
jgi:alkanesulfonate monooxygenase SsuD/methylene tetrahydromethanopterin reductase-like flavin-dependent oxidoreductase (luciferase family)